ncbi:MBL fold metallo-hydrolase [Solirubrobacter ginsenosidimutans]|uniref:MBL fold metallo-hydrolase n=1 Tax=Solirubrobacter ginsenosidimutans TaxID=490573 RepID=A0A9X3S291_9ACTN|nr:MBL fold metallo-hydrolase [Solirubrobacter ginsenosidimutans]
MYEVATGVHRIVLPLPGDGLKAVDVYAIEDGEGLALVDTGWRHPGLVEALTDGFAALDATLADLTAIVCTHSHYDHYGLAAELRSLSGAPVLLGEQERLNLDVALDRDLWDRDKLQRGAQLRLHGAGSLAETLARADFTFEQVQERGFVSLPDRWVADGERITLGSGRVLEARLTPGHSRGHLMYLDAEAGVLFAGDHVLPHITPSIGFEAFSDGHGLEAFLASLTASRDLPVAVVAPGHGPVFGDLAGRVDELLAHHERRLAACVAILAADGPAPAAEVAAKLTWTRHERAFDTLNLFNRMLATTETITHLELLATRGSLLRAPDGEILRYALP